MALITEQTADGRETYKRHNDWLEILEPVLINFEKIGQRICGTLLELKVEKIRDDSVPTARLEDEDGVQVKIRLAFDLRQKLARRHVGRKLLIVFNEERDTGNPNNKMKVFRVFVAPEEGDQEPPFIPTDDDLPPGI